MKDQIITNFLKVSLAVGSVCALVPLVNAQGIGVTELEKRLVSTPHSIERGKELYSQNCAVCHGQDGQGKTGVQLAGASGQDFNTADFTQAEYRLAKGPIQAFNVISYGLEDAVPPPEEGEEAGEAAQLPPHPTFEFLQYQSRWDLVHYIRSLGPTAELVDPPGIIAKARDRAEFGVCDEAIKESIADKVAPQGEEQIEKGKEIYATTCASCHGDDGKGDGLAAAALTPGPRDFHVEDAEDWTNSPSALSVFNSITNGVPGTSMAAYENLSEDDRWALTQLVLQWVPDDVRIDPTEEQIVDACRSLSAPDRPDPIPVDVAMKALEKSQAEERAIRLEQYGTVKLQPGTDVELGERTFVDNCAACHGMAGSGADFGPYGIQPPYFYMSTSRLSPASAGGSTDAFAERSYAGVHATMGEMSAAAMLSQSAWANLQAYVATLEGDAEITIEEVAPAAEDEDEAEEQGEAEEAAQDTPAEEAPPAEDPAE